MDGRVCLQNEASSFAAPLSCILSQSEKLVPLGMMPNVRVQFSLDSLASMFVTSTIAAVTASYLEQATAASTTPTEYTISDFVICYTMVQFPVEVDNIVKSMGDKILLKSQSFSLASSVIPVTTAGTIELVYSQRLASVKSLFFHCSSASINGIFDSYEITTGGTYQFSVAGKYYPNRPIDASSNKVGILQELRKAVKNVTKDFTEFSINTVEFGRVIGTPSTTSAPAKCYVGCTTSIMTSNNVLLSGISTQNSPITVRLNILTSIPTGYAVNASLICSYDAIIEIDPLMKNAIVRQ
jgi:hypothetical protein